MILKYPFAQKCIQMICVFCASFGLLSDGMHVSWSSPSMNLLMREDSPFNVEKQDMVWLEILTPLFIMVGLPLICCADKLGRKLIVILSCFVGLVGWSLIAIGNRKEFLYVTRSLAGTTAAVSFVSLPMYITEIADKEIRGFLISFFFVMFHMGVIVMYTVAPNTSLRTPPIIGISLLLVELVTLPFFPETPYYYIFKKDEKAAKRSLTFFQGERDVDEKLASMRTELAEQSKKIGFKALFDMKTKKFMIILILLHAAQPATGYIAFLMNINTIMESVGFTSMTPNAVTVVYSLVMLVASVISMLLVDKLGRRILLGISTFCTTLSLLTLAVFFHLRYLEFNLDAMNWIPVVSVNAFALFFKAGLGTVPTVLVSELCPLEFRTLGMVTAELVYNTFACISIYFFHYAMENYGLSVVFYLFSLLSIISFVLIYILIPETKGKTLLEIQAMLES